ncbi:AMP-binding protein [uncultured Roseovarius sp.]|uniref:AMP-binding protein n=1 Tax=uncultured Roseovarius sp. TaxID=293344 RepID=UPI002615C2A9|nr:AMP-binding protein [uncultured Roseovarius sp.]
MLTSQHFNIHENSTVLSPGVAGVDVLVNGLQTGSSILAQQSKQNPIRTKKTNEQMLFCETSGTSGQAKTIRRRPESWVKSFYINRQDFALGPGDTYATIGHLGHSLSLYATLEAFHIGADILMLSSLSPKNQINRMIENQVTVIYATPSQLHLLMRGAGALGLTSLPEVRHIFSGGGKLEGTHRQHLAELFPNAAIREFFGASETSFISITDRDTPDGSVGRPYPGVTLEIRNNMLAQPGETGEIWVTSPYLFEGYEGAGTTETQWDGKYLSIGEMGYLDANGHLFLRGRKNRMVTVSDTNVFPEEIEKSLMALPQITLCAALGLPDEKRGHKILCAIEGRAFEGMEKQLRQRCRDALGAPAVPHRFIFLDKIPLLAAGKPDLQTLQQLLGSTP